MGATVNGAGFLGATVPFFHTEAVTHLFRLSKERDLSCGS